MNINTLEVLKDYEGNALTYNSKEKNEVKEKELTIRAVLMICLNEQIPNKLVTAEEKNKIYGLSVKLYNSSEVDLTSDDINFIKEKLGESITWNSLVYGRVCEILNSSSIN